MSTLILEDGTANRHHKDRLNALLKSTEGVIRVATAYLTDETILRHSDGDRRLLLPLRPMDLVSGATKIEPIRTLIESGVECRSLPDSPRFHAKVYVLGDSRAIVSSANLTSNALHSNIEAGVELTGTAVHELITWFDTLWNVADKITMEGLALLQKQIKPLRKEYEGLKRKARRRVPTVTIDKDAGPLTDSLCELLGNADRFFICNSFRRDKTRTATGGYKFEEEMHTRGYAAAWETFNYPGHMEQVRKGDAIFMFAKGIGIIGIGEACGPYEKLKVAQSGRISIDSDEVEWRVPVQWLVWTDEAGAFPYNAGNVTFVDVTERADFRANVKRHFTGG